MSCSTTFPGVKAGLINFSGPFYLSVPPGTIYPTQPRRLAPTTGAEIGRIASKYVRVSLPAPPPTSPPHSPALTADKAEVATAEQARPPRLDLSTTTPPPPPPPHPTTPHQQQQSTRTTRVPAEPTPDKVEGIRDSREQQQHRITTTTTTAANMNHHHHHTQQQQQQQQKAGEQQLSEPEDMEMEGKQSYQEG